MPPIPCLYCGQNFMRTDLNPDALRLCNNCSNKEFSKNQKGIKKVDTITILIECPKEIHAEIEELCISKGLSLSNYFLDLHINSLDSLRQKEEPIKPESFEIDIGETDQKTEKQFKKRGKAKLEQVEF